MTSSKWVVLTDKASVMEVVSVVKRIMPDGQFGECWEWQLLRDRHGYGKKGPKLAHRVVYELLVGKIPNGLEIDHLCRNRLCVNPAHLEPVTGKENTLRGESFSAKNARKIFCRHGHPFDEANTYLRPCGHRGCYKCYAEASRKYRAKQREGRAA